MNLGELQKEVESMISKYGSDTTVVRQDSQSWIKDINCLRHADIDFYKEMVIIG